MSKAFTKESDDSGEVDLPEAPELKLPTGVKNYITPGGAERLKNELKQLLHVERPEVVKTVAWAASNGDRSENGDYIYGKRRLREIDRRIRFLTRRLEQAEIVDPEGQTSEKIVFGATVTVEDEQGKSRTYTIVGVDEIDAAQGRVSWVSPVGKALLGAAVGDVVTLRTPKGEEELEILDVQYKRIK